MSCLLLQEEDSPSPPTRGQDGSFVANKKEPLPPDPIETASLSLDTLKDHSVLMEARVRWLNHLSNMLPLKLENRDARKSLTAERMETELVVAAYAQVIAYAESHGGEELQERVGASSEFLGPGNVISLAELCPAPPTSPNSADKEKAWEEIASQRPDWNSHLWGNSLRYWKGVKKDQYQAMGVSN